MEIPKATVRIVGTSHIARQSVQRITHSFDEFTPEIVCVELDKQRLEALREQAAGVGDRRLPLSLVGQIGVTGYLFALVARAVQKRVGNIVGVHPGLDMLAAVNLASERKAQAFLIDQDIRITLRHLSKRFTFREKARVVLDVLGAPFGKRVKSFPLNKIPSDDIIKELVGLLRDRYPSLYHVLIVERNVVMATRIDALVRKHPGKKLLVVVGAGHEEDLRERLKPLAHLAEIK